MIDIKNKINMWVSGHIRSKPIYELNDHPLIFGLCVCVRERERERKRERQSLDVRFSTVKARVL